MKAFLLALFLPFTLTALSLEEKVGQLFLVHFVGDSASGDAQKLIEEAHVGGFIFYNWSQKLDKCEEIKKLTDDLQKRSPTPLFIAVDQEGGLVRRLKFYPHPSNKSVGETGDPHGAHLQAQEIAGDLKKCGINFNLAPVADIAESKGMNPERCFGKDPELVAQFVQEAVKAYQEAHVICSLKHFPGHGSVSVDSHLETPRQDKTLAALYASDLVPFREAEVIMTGHIIVSCLDPRYPATFSAPVLEGLLRQTIGFQGVIISDSLVMSGAQQYFPSLEETVQQAFLAGCDILLFGGQNLQIAGRNELKVEEILSCYQAFLNAVKSGKIPEARVDESVARILALKKKYLLS